jgi:hypothetical protein
MNTTMSIGIVQVMIQRDLEYAKVGGMSLRLDLYTPSGRRPGFRHCCISMAAPGRSGTSPTGLQSVLCRSRRTGSPSRARTSALSRR